jgi:hypothetical protein
MDAAATRFLPRNSKLNIRQTLAVSSLHLLFTFTVLLLEQVHSEQSAQIRTTKPHGDAGLQEQKRIVGQDVDASWMPCSQHARKWRQRQHARLESADNVAAAADPQPVISLSKLAAPATYTVKVMSIDVFIWFDSPFCGGALISAHICLPKHVASKLLRLLICTDCCADRRCSEWRQTRFGFPIRPK